MSEKVTYNEMAKRLGVDPSTIRRLVKKHSINVQQGRANTINGKWMHYLTSEDADRLAACYKASRTPVKDSATEESYQRSGHFYVIQLVPEFLPNRIKIGYTDNLEKRLKEHQTAAPTAKVVSSWPCKRSWDPAVMDSITRDGCSWVDNEVFEGAPEGFVDRGNAFFAHMPNPDAERPLSTHSPRRRGEVLDEG
jgi:hypothetical protein